MNYAEDPCTEEGKGLPHEEVSPEISNRETERQKGKIKKQIIDILASSLKNKKEKL